MRPPSRQDFLTVPDGTRLYYQVSGEGETGVVLCDGLGCDGFAWKYLQGYLERQFRVVRWHYRGHGRSGVPRDRSRVGMHHTCDDLARVMDAAGLERAVVFGHSMGVQVALEFHRRQASRVSGLVLICGSSGHPLDTFYDSTYLKRAFPYLRQAVERWPRAASTFMRVAMGTPVPLRLALLLEVNRAMVAPQDLVPYFEHLARMDPVVFVRTLDSLAHHSCADHLPHVDVPTLVVAGEKDGFTPEHCSRRMAQAIPGSEFLLVPQGSHTAPLEQPELIELRVERFIHERIAPARPRAQRPAARAVRRQASRG